jgi:hypothetical protein
MENSPGRKADLEGLVEAALAERLGDISGLPEEVKKKVRRVYGDFVAGYLNMVIQKEKRAPEWLPNSLTFDSEVVDDMRHFFSDYQHLTREFNRINQQLDRLKKIDPARQSRLYQKAVDDILAGEEKAGNLEVFAG